MKLILMITSAINLKVDFVYHDVQSRHKHKIKWSVYYIKNIVGKHKDGLKAYQCSFDAWDYCQAAGKLYLIISKVSSDPKLV